MEFIDTEVWGFRKAVHGMRDPYESWDKSDSKMENGNFIFGTEDLALAQNLIVGGSEHSKFMRMIHVQVDVVMPRYWWSEADTYHFGTKNSSSTMHNLLNNSKPITKEMFVTCDEDNDITDVVVERLESLRQQYRETKDYAKQTKLLIRAKRLLPEGLEQLRTWDTNYTELRNIYFQRKNHRLKEEWQDTFCKWVETLPYAKELITYKKENNT